MIDIVIYCRQPHTPSRHRRMFFHGLAAHGIRAEFRMSSMYRPSDLAVFWAHKNTTAIEGQRRIGKDYLVMERGYFGDRFAMTSLGYNGLNGHAEFHNENSPPDRWLKYGTEVRPWKHDGEVIVLMGQVPTDASLRNCPNYARWVNTSAETAAALYGTKVYFRPHPHPAAQAFKPRLPVIGGTLESALDRASAVIIWNSNSGVDAVLRGVPLIACDKGSMASAMGVNRIGMNLVRPVCS